MAEKPRCFIQSETPGQATIDEAIAVLEQSRSEIADKISMPAQDHLHCSLTTAIGSLYRLQRVERQCAEHNGHRWVWSPWDKLSEPRVRDRICSVCFRYELTRAEYDGMGRIADVEEWEKYYR